METKLKTQIRKSQITWKQTHIKTEKLKKKTMNSINLIKTRTPKTAFQPI
jgi:hypothetical protein